jgi:hypothetical protein
MDESTTEEVRRLFADITGRLEDASLIAVEGQAISIDAPAIRQITSALKLSLDEVESRLTQIENLCSPD